jgi:hypothetical protein
MVSSPKYTIHFQAIPMQILKSRLGCKRQRHRCLGYNPIDEDGKSSITQPKSTIHYHPITCPNMSTKCIQIQHFNPSHPRFGSKQKHFMYILLATLHRKLSLDCSREFFLHLSLLLVQHSWTCTNLKFETLQWLG